MSNCNFIILNAGRDQIIQESDISVEDAQIDILKCKNELLLKEVITKDLKILNLESENLRLKEKLKSLGVHND